MVQSQPTSRTIAGLARAGRVGVETVRYYQRRGLMDAPPRSQGPRRYDQEALRRLRFIRSAQSAGFTLDEIKELLALDAGEDRARVRVLAEERLNALSARIEELTKVRTMLQRLTTDCGMGKAGPCPILAAFEAG